MKIKINSDLEALINNETSFSDEIIKSVIELYVRHRFFILKMTDDYTHNPATKFKDLKYDVVYGDNTIVENTENDIKYKESNYLLIIENNYAHIVFTLNTDFHNIQSIWELEHEIHGDFFKKAHRLKISTKDLLENRLDDWSDSL